MKQNTEARTLHRRNVLKAGGAGVALSALSFPTVLRAQSGALKVGVVLPLSGVLSFPGIATRRGTDLAVKMFAEQGVKLDVSYADTESKPENGRVAAERLIRDGCSIVIGWSVVFSSTSNSSLMRVSTGSGSRRVTMTFTFEVEDAPKPSCVAEIIFRYYE